MRVRKLAVVVLFLMVAAAMPALGALTVRNGTQLTVEASLDEILEPAIQSKQLGPRESWVPAGVSPDGHYRLAFRQGDRELAAATLHGTARTATLLLTPGGYRVAVSSAERAPAIDDASAVALPQCLRGHMIGLVLGCLTFNADNGQSFTVTGNTSHVPLLGPTCLCGEEVGKVADCLAPGLFVNSQCPIGGANAEVQQSPLIVRNLTPQPVRVAVQHPPAMVVFTRDIPAQGSITLEGGQLTTVLTFFSGENFLARAVVRDAAVAALEKIGSRYIVAVVQNQIDDTVRASESASTSAPTIGCWSGTSIGLLMDSRAFSSEGQTFYLSGNLSGVPFLGRTCVCGTLLPPNEKAPIPLPIIQVAERCEQ